MKKLILKALLGFFAIGISAGNSMAQGFDVEKITLPNDEKLDSILGSSQGAKSVYFRTRNSRVGVLNDNIATLFPEMIDYDYTAVDFTQNGYVLFTSGSCNAHIGSALGLSQVFSINSTSCFIDGQINENKKAALVLYNSSVVASAVYNNGTSNLAIIPNVDSSFVSIGIIELNNQNEVFGFYTRLINGLPVNKLFKYTEAAGLIELPNPSSDNLYDYINNFDGQQIPSGEILFLPNQTDAYLWNPTTGAVKTTPFANYKDYYQAKNINSMITFENGELEDYACAIPHRNKINTLTVEAITSNNKLVGRIGYSDGIVVLKRNQKPITNYCLNGNDFTVKPSTDCKKYIRRIKDETIQFKKSSTDKSCTLNFKLRKNGENLRGVNVARKVDYKLNKIVKTNKQGVATFTFKIGDDYNEFIAGFRDSKFRASTISARKEY